MAGGHLLVGGDSREFSRGVVVGIHGRNGGIQMLKQLLHSCTDFGEFLRTGDRYYGGHGGIDDQGHGGADFRQQGFAGLRERGNEGG